MKKSLFITGASGCVGHYVLDLLLGRQDLELHLLLRDPARVQRPLADYDNVVVHRGNMDSIEELAPVLAQMDYVLHIFTDWSDSDYAHLLNVTKTHAMFEMATNAERIVYFSTASILGPGNVPIWQAGEYGHGYIRSKYQGYQSLKKSPVADKVVTVFPTLVFGGDDSHPYSHISSGLMPNQQFLKWLRFIYIDGAFHFLHAKDIAQVAVHLLDAEIGEKRDFALGTEKYTAKRAIQILAKAFGYKQPFRIKINPKFVMKIAGIFGIKIGPWERYCIENPYFSYDVVEPKTFGLETAFPTLESVVADIQSRG
jgi:nucleoside-diphosphate-sugar epimerase